MSSRLIPTMLKLTLVGAALLLALVLVVTWQFGKKVSYPVVGRYLDYDCTPLSRAKIKLRASVSSRAPYGGGWQYLGETTTDGNGVFRFDMELTGSLHSLDFEASRAGDRWQGRRQLSARDSGRITESSLDNPLIVYREHPHDYAHRVTDRLVVPLDYRGNGGRFGHSAANGDNRKLFDAQLRWRRGDGGWQLLLGTAGDGGYRPLPVEDLPFDNSLPVDGYRRIQSMRLPDAENPLVRRAYYYRHDGGRAHGTLFISARYSTAGARNGALVKLFYDLVPDDGVADEPPYLPQYRCGGALARQYDGFFGQAPDPAVDHADRKPLAAPLDDDKRRIAADPDTPASWFELYRDDLAVLRAGLDHQGAIDERVAIIYAAHRDHLVERMEVDQKVPSNLRSMVVYRLAGDHRVEPAILEDIESRFPLASIVLRLAANPRLPASRVDEYAARLLDGRYRHDPVVSNELGVLQRLGANPRLGAAPLRRLSAHLSSELDQGRDYLAAAKRLLENPALPGDVLAFWIDRVDADPRLSNLLPTLLSNPAMSSGQLLRLADITIDGEPAWRRHGHFLIVNPRSGGELLQRFAALGRDIGKVDLGRALAHPNFGPDYWPKWLHGKHNRGRIEALMAARPISRGAGHSPAAPRYLVSADALRYIFDNDQPGLFTAGIAAHPNTPMDILETLQGRDDRTLDYALLRNPALPAATLRRLWRQLPATPGDRYLAGNPSAPPDLLETIGRRDASLTRRLLENPATPPSLLEHFYRVARDTPDGKASPDTLLDTLLMAILNHGNAPEELLESILVAYDDERYRYRVASNPGAPGSVLGKIAAQAYSLFGEGEARLDSGIARALLDNPATPPEVRRRLPRYCPPRDCGRAANRAGASRASAV